MAGTAGPETDSETGPAKGSTGELGPRITPQGVLNHPPDAPAPPWTSSYPKDPVASRGGYTYYDTVLLADMLITQGTGVYLTPYPQTVGTPMDVAIALRFKDEGELVINKGMRHWVFVRWMCRPSQILNDCGFECTEDMFAPNEILRTNYFNWVTLDTVEG